MSNIYLLDCTLRDGGYVNNWVFGADGIQGMKEGLEQAGVDMIELGFIRNECVDLDRSVFSDAADLHSRIAKEDRSAIYSAMIEGTDPEGCYPIDRLGTPVESGIDLIRVCTWKRLMKEHLSYCRGIAAHGYLISVQPTAVEQYSLNEFTELLKRADGIQPFSFYIVDTWGTQSPLQISRYLELAERYLNPNIKIGYHGHNNKMQTLSCVQSALSMGLSHDLCIDASIMGMGRGVGNLQTEVIMDYLNETQGKHYDKFKIIELFYRYLRDIYAETPWGYSIYHFLSAQYSCPQDFATYFKEKNYGEHTFQRFLSSLRPEEKIVFRAGFVETRLKELGLS